MIKSHETLQLILTAIRQDLFNASDNYEVLNGEYGAVLRPLMLNVEREAQLNLVDTARKTASELLNASPEFTPSKP